MVLNNVSNLIHITESILKPILHGLSHLGTGLKHTFKSVDDLPANINLKKLGKLNRIEKYKNSLKDEMWKMFNYKDPKIRELSTDEYNKRSSKIGRLINKNDYRINQLKDKIGNNPDNFDPSIVKSQVNLQRTGQLIGQAGAVTGAGTLGYQGTKLLTDPNSEIRKEFNELPSKIKHHVTKIYR